MSKHENTIEIISDAALEYDVRNTSRSLRLSEGTMALKKHFVDGGDDEMTAISKVTQVSREVSSSAPNSKLDYTLGDTQPLKDAIQAIDELDYPFFNQSAKDSILNVL